jgi:hypothetical protein
VRSGSDVLVGEGDASMRCRRAAKDVSSSSDEADDTVGDRGVGNAEGDAQSCG